MSLLKTRVWIVCCLVMFAGSVPATDYQVYFLAGQSNMVGYGFNTQLPNYYREPLSGVMIFDGARVYDKDVKGGIGIWSELQPGHGLGFETDGNGIKLSDRYGPELSFASTLLKGKPSERIAIIKYARGGSSLFPGGSGYGTWNPDFDGNNQYDNALRAIRLAHSSADIDGDGHADRLIPAGIVWMQGEADAYFSQAAADAYEDNLRDMMERLRAALRVDDLPVVIGKITGGKTPEGKIEIMDYLQTVQQAQRQYVEKDTCAAYVTIADELSFTDDDPWHYDSQSYIRMGVAFAEAMAQLLDDCEIDP